MAILPLAPNQTIAQMWSNGVRGGCYELRSQESLHHPGIHIPTEMVGVYQVSEKTRHLIYHHNFGGKCELILKEILFTRTFLMKRANSPGMCCYTTIK